MAGIHQIYMEKATTVAREGLWRGIQARLGSTIPPSAGIVQRPWTNQISAEAARCLRVLGGHLRPRPGNRILSEFSTFHSVPRRTPDPLEANHLIAANLETLPVLVDGLLRGKDSTDPIILETTHSALTPSSQAVLQFIATISSHLIHFNRPGSFTDEMRQRLPRVIETRLLTARRWAVAGDVAMMEHALEGALLDIALLGGTLEPSLIQDCYKMAYEGALRSAWLFAGEDVWMEVERALHDAVVAASKAGITADGTQIDRLKTRLPLSADEGCRANTAVQQYRALFPSGHRLAHHPGVQEIQLPA